MCPLTFCQLFRRIFIVLFVAIAVWQGIWASTIELGLKAFPHLLMSITFLIGAITLMIFDTWWESRRP